MRTPEESLLSEVRAAIEEFIWFNDLPPSLRGEAEGILNLLKDY